MLTRRKSVVRLWRKGNAHVDGVDEDARPRRRYVRIPALSRVWSCVTSGRHAIRQSLLELLSGKQHGIPRRCQDDNLVQAGLVDHEIVQQHFVLERFMGRPRGAESLVQVHVETMYDRRVGFYW